MPSAFFNVIFTYRVRRDFDPNLEIKYYKDIQNLDSFESITVKPEQLEILNSIIFSPEELSKFSFCEMTATRKL